ncbi:MAG: glutamate synthase large subunit, partial [Candidatus Saganbacteria bacterium]|nr:glutamate synthase large subunit [Candidatus Saganbacteria bacterium]
MHNGKMPQSQGLYDPQFEHDSCGVGFVVNINGEKSHTIIQQGLKVLKRLAHRGAVGADPKTGDGAGILIQIPHEFYAKKIEIPRYGSYGTGLIFLSQNKRLRNVCKEVIARIIEDEGQVLVGWRTVPVDDSDIGKAAKETQPAIEQIFIAKGKEVNTRLDLERKLYKIRRHIEKEIKAEGFYITNLSTRTIAYKGLLMPHQLENYFLDLKDPDLKSAIALVHSRYSTNTFPAWDLAQPFRFLAHNGEINTLRGNINWMRARGIDVIVPGGSDSSALDNVFELLVLSGRPMFHAMMMLIPGAWEQNKLMNKEVRDFYQYHACFMESWDGPAAVAFTDGKHVGAVLDRNGLRPARYIITKSGLVVMASEVGVLDIDPKDIAVSGRLEPGRMFYIDTETQRIVEDEEIKEEIYSRRFYGQWLKENMVRLKDLPRAGMTRGLTLLGNRTKQDCLKAFGYSREELKVILKPMAEKGKEPIGSMGNDTPHAILSQRPQLLYNYFKQSFAQVTNPAIDPIREDLVMSLESYVGPEQNILEETPQHCHKLKVENPTLLNEELKRIKYIRKNNFKTKTVPVLFKLKEPLNEALDRVCRETEEAISEGCTFIILSDRGFSKDRAALPALLAVGAVHHHLIRKALRTKIGIIVESAEPREVHHFALLFGYGADLVNPYLAYEAIEFLVEVGDLILDTKTAINNFRKAVNKGILKILSKMGISTLNSYRGAQIFEALGLSGEVVEKCFDKTPSRIGGIGFEEIAKETIIRHSSAFEDGSLLPSGGVYQLKRDGEFHLWNPLTISALQDATRQNDYGRYKEFSRLINDQSENPTTLRSLLKFKKTESIPISEVEPVQSIVKRFATGAMSFGSISGRAHETIARAMNMIGGKSNTGEGGEDPLRFGDDCRSAIKQVASGRFGVTTNYLVNADELQIKIAQGAKPGEGGQLPGHKVSAIIAKTRYTTPGVTLISPPPHHDIYSIEDLAQLIFDLKNVNPQARISVKLVSEVGVGTVAAGVAKGHADMILISGCDGGTGASPLSSIRHAGLPWELGLAETHQTLVLNNLRSRVRLQTDGQLRTGRDVAIAALLGAEEFGFATAALIVCGCVMLRHCHLNNCVLGVATQDECLAKRFKGKPEYLVNYFNFLAQELREIMAELGISTIDELVGRSDLLEVDRSKLTWKSKNIDFSKILYRPEETGKACCTKARDHNVVKVLDQKLIKLSWPALKRREAVRHELKINNMSRTTGGMLSGEVVKRYGEEGLFSDTIHFKFCGGAGQSFGAWLARGITFELEGMANDYVGKGISGGKIILYPDKRADYRSEENILIGNTAFYGAISGEAYIRGVAGERFCIRNSGLLAVVEGVGDHGCEYMTGGYVVILGKTGRNFAAGMSGGIAYVYDREGEFAEKCNLSMVELEELNQKDQRIIQNLLKNHFKYTRSPLAKNILDDFGKEKYRFVKVMPIEYKRVLLKKAMDEEELEL